MAGHNFHVISRTVFLLIRGGRFAALFSNLLTFLSCKYSLCLFSQTVAQELGRRIRTKQTNVVPEIKDSCVPSTQQKKKHWSLLNLYHLPLIHHDPTIADRVSTYTFSSWEFQKAQKRKENMLPNPSPVGACGCLSNMLVRSV